MYHYANVKFLPLVAEMGNPLKKYPDKLNFPWQYADQYECWWSTIYSSISIPGYKYILMHWKNISSVQSKFYDNSRLKRSIKLWLLWRIFRLFFFHQKQCIALHCNVKEISAHRYLWPEKKKILEKVLWIITNKLDWNCLEEFFWHRSISQKDSLNVCSFFMWDIPKRISPTKKAPTLQGSFKLFKPQCSDVKTCLSVVNRWTLIYLFAQWGKTLSKAFLISEIFISPTKNSEDLISQNKYFPFVSPKLIKISPKSTKISPKSTAPESSLSASPIISFIWQW